MSVFIQQDSRSTTCLVTRTVQQKANSPPIFAFLRNFSKACSPSDNVVRIAELMMSYNPSFYFSQRKRRLCAWPVYDVVGCHKLNQQVGYLKSHMGGAFFLPSPM